MKEGTRKFLTSVFVPLLAFSIGTIPFSGVEKVNATEEDSWTTLAPLPTPFYKTIGAAAVDGKIYFIGGNITEQYDPETNTWTSIAPLPIYNGWATVVACQNKIYVIGGNAEDPTQVYDPATETWENRTSIPTTRTVSRANVVDGKIYVISGQIPSPLGVVNPSSSNDVYDPATDSWSKMAPISIPVIGYASAVSDNKIYIIGGGNASGGVQNAINQVQIFDPQTNQWTNGTPIPTGVAYASAYATTGLSAPKRIYVIGGTLTYNWNRYSPPGTDLNQVYDPETGLWWLLCLRLAIVQL
jgi:N-acetylneuraminic acid mutarotase